MTLPNDREQGFSILLCQAAAGRVNFVAASGAALQSRTGYSKTAGQWSEVSLTVDSNSGGAAASWVLVREHRPMSLRRLWTRNAVDARPADAVRPISTQSVAFFQRLATQPSAARKALYDTLIRALVGGGHLGEARRALRLCRPRPRRGGADQSRCFGLCRERRSIHRHFGGPRLHRQWLDELCQHELEAVARRSIPAELGALSLWSLTSRSAANSAQGIYAGGGDVVIFPYYPGSIGVGPQ